MDNKDIVIIGLVVLLVVAVLFSTGVFTGTTGKTTTWQCSDSDQGSNYVKGTISGTSHNGQPFGPTTDYCSAESANELKEYSCDSNTESGWKSEMVLCDNGCSNGACLT